LAAVACGDLSASAEPLYNRALAMQIGAMGKLQEKAP